MKNKTIIISISILILNSCGIPKSFYKDGYTFNSNNEDQRSNIRKEFNNNILEEIDKKQDVVAIIDLNDKLILEKESVKDTLKCDKILLKNGEEIDVKVLEISPNEVKYKKCDNVDGPIVTTYKNDVFMVKYSNGSKEVFNNETFGNTMKSEYKSGMNSLKENNLKKHGMAVTGFVTSIIGFFLFGFVFGLLAVIFSGIGLNKINNDPDRWSGKGLATAGIIIGIIDIIGWLLLIAIFFL
jgi:hypothetical protein